MIHQPLVTGKVGGLIFSPYPARPLKPIKKQLLIKKVNLMSSKELLEKALKLKPVEKFILVEGILRSLGEPDSTIGQIWTDEAVKRLKAYRKETRKEFRWRKSSTKNNESNFFKISQADQECGDHLSELNPLF